MSKNLDLFKKDISHIWVAYSYFESCIPHGVPLPHRVGGAIGFQTPGHIKSIEVELGWAFFTRLEACLEAHLHRIGVDARGNDGLLGVLNNNGVEMSQVREDGLLRYRALRNALHHGDGDVRAIRNPGVLTDEITEDGETHLLRAHVRAFYQLFVWVAEALDDVE